jgi:hypothetical protein
VRFGFFLGFLVGAAVASVFSKAERRNDPSSGEPSLTLELQASTEPKAPITQVTTEAKAPSTPLVTTEPSVVDAPKNVIEQLRQHTREAIDAAREAKDEKEAEMLREFEEATRPQPSEDLPGAAGKKA